MSILPVDNINRYTGGEKAYGLSLLKLYNLNTPFTFLIRSFNENALEKYLDSLPDDYVFLLSYSPLQNNNYERLNKSFSNLKKLEVIPRLKEMFEGERFGENDKYVVIQEMVDAKISGSIKTADVINNRIDKLRLKIFNHQNVPKDSKIKPYEELLFLKHNFQEVKSSILNQTILHQLINEASKVERLYKRNVKLDFTIDKQNRIWWLNLEEINLNDDVHYNELDSKPFLKKPVYGIANRICKIQQPATPLFISVFAYATDFGLQNLFTKLGAQKGVCVGKIYLHTFYNNLFIDVRRVIENTAIIGNSIGKSIKTALLDEEVNLINAENLPQRNNRTHTYIKSYLYLNGSKRSYYRIKKLEKRLKIICPDKIEDCYKLIDLHLDYLNKAWKYYFVTFIQSVYYNGNNGLANSGKNAKGYLKSRSINSKKRELKSMELINEIHQKFNDAYNYLGNLLYKEAYLSSPTDIYFLTHDELGKLIADGDKKIFISKIEKRKNIQHGLKGLKFKNIYNGLPYPVEEKLVEGFVEYSYKMKTSIG